MYHDRPRPGDGGDQREDSDDANPFGPSTDDLGNEHDSPLDAPLPRQPSRNW